MSHDQPQAWRTVTIEDLGQVVTGRTPPSSKPEMFGSEYPFITPSDMSFGLRRVTTERSISLAGSLALGRIKLPPKSVAFVCIGATIGKVCLTFEDSFTNQQINSIVVDCDRHSPEFVYYLMLGMVDKVKALAGGAATPIVNKSSFCGILVSIPPIEIQSKIAFILSAYDDLIENNTRRIEILEEIARRLYEEWFVQFRFPGYEGVFDTDGLPQGWRYSKLSEIASYIGRGISPKYDEEADCLVINQKCIRNQRLDVQLSRRQSKKVPVEKLIQFGDVLINSTGVGTLGRVAQVHEVLEHVTVDSHVTIARAGEFVDVDYFGSTLLSMQHFFELQGVGSTGQTELSRSRIAEADVIVPPYELQTRFGKSIRSMRLLCAQLAKKNSNLRAQRDLLLPKLISGEIDVSDIPMPT